jgi:hypothetical protein
MVEGAFERLRREQDQVGGRSRPLTVVVVFRRAAIIHLKSDLGILNATLLHNKFYAGLDAAQAKVRLPGASHGRATLDYLTAVERAARPITNTAPGFYTPLVRFGEIAAVMVSRDLWDRIQLFPGLLRVVTESARATIRSVSLPGWVAIVAFGVLGPVVIESLLMIARLVSARLLQPGIVLGTVHKALFEFGTLLLNIPFVLLTMSVTNYDLENLLTLDQSYGVPLADSLRWAAGVATSAVAVPFAVLVALAVATAWLEWRKLGLLSAFYESIRGGEGAGIAGSARATAGRTLVAVRKFGISALAMIKSALWLASAILLSGMTAAYLVIGALLRRLASVLVLKVMARGAGG